MLPLVLWNVTNIQLICNDPVNITYASAHLILPLGWFLLCGTAAYTYVAASATGGPCTVGHVTRSILPFMTERQRTPWHILAATCNPHVSLFPHAEALGLLLRVAGIPGVVAHSCKQLEHVACALAQGLKWTSVDLMDIK